MRKIISQQRRAPVSKRIWNPNEETQFEYEHMLLLEFFGRKVYELRNRDWLTQEQLAEKLNFTQAQVSHLETGAIDFHISTLLKIATYFKVEPCELLPDIYQMDALSKIIGGWGWPRKGQGLIQAKLH